METQIEIIKKSVLNFSDEDLVKEIVKSNDTLLFEILYDRYVDVVYNKCLSFAKNEDEAKDLSQDVFLKLFIKLASFKGKSKFSTWLYAFTYNHCVNYITRNTAKKIEKESVDIEDIENITEIENISDDESKYSFHQMKVDKLKKALKKIPSKDKMILLLKHQDYLSIKEIKEVLNISESAVKMRLKRAKEKLILIYKNNSYNE